MTAIAPPTDRRLFDFLEGVQFAVCPIIAIAMDLRQKEKGRFTGEASKFRFTCKPSLIFHLISRQSLVSVAGCFSSVWVSRGKVFGLNTLRRRKILPETVLPLGLAAAIRAIRYLCIRASGTGDWRDEFQLYHRLLALPQERSNVIGVSLLVALISFITKRLNRILSLLHILNATAVTTSMLYVANT